jgi:threonine/homoserine/homoserine lactone efflux protein
MFLLFALSALALVIVPGPNLIYIVTRRVYQGRRFAVGPALGVETATLIHVAAAGGLAALLASSAAAFELVKHAGAVYLATSGCAASCRTTSSRTATRRGGPGARACARRASS